MQMDEKAREQEREDMKDILVKAFADGHLDEAGLEARLKTLESKPERADLVALGREIQALYPSPERLPQTAEGPAAHAPAAMRSIPEDVQVIRGTGMSTVRKGRWFTQKKILVEIENSNLVLDFSQLCDFPGSKIEILVDMLGSNCLMRFPKGSFINEDIENHGSNVRVTHKGDNLYRLEIQIRGRVKGSNLRVKTKAFY